MKRILLIVLMLPLLATSQDSTMKQSRTNLGKINLTAGKVLRKEYIDLASYFGSSFFLHYNLQVQMLLIHDVGTGEQFNGLIVSTDKGGLHYSSYIDADEIPTLIKFIEMFSKLQGQGENNYVEYDFTSRDLQFYTYSKMDKKGKPAWQYGLKIDQYYEGIIVEMPLKEFEDLKQKLIDALPKLKPN